MKEFRIIEISGFTSKSATALWNGRTIDTHTSFDLDDFDFGILAEIQLQKCKQYIKKKEKEDGWIAGNVIPYIVTAVIDEL
jgi:hypothetical protein